MSDTPAIPIPADPSEQGILDRLLRIRDSLKLMKQDKTKYIRSNDVFFYYDRVIYEVHYLNELRKNKQSDQERNAGMAHVLLSEAHYLTLFLVDNVLDDCFQLISLLFLTVGRNNEAPAV